MAKYIDRDALLEKIEQVRWISKNSFPRQHFVVGDVMSCIRTATDVDVVGVRHGRWIGIEYDGYADGCPVYDLWECSECGEEVKGEDVPATHPWCHSCGARMDKEDEHEAD